MDHRSPRLLLVDDDPIAVRTMSRLLSRWPDQRFATSGRDALRVARESRPAMLLVDVDMPGMTGLELYSEMQADPELAQVPVIFVSSARDPALEATVLEGGALDFVGKPLDGSRLAARVAAGLRRVEQATVARRPLRARLHPARARVAAAAHERAGRALPRQDRQARIAAEAAQAASQAKTLMMSAIAHEIGNPLHAILGFSRLVTEDETTPVAPAHRAWLDQVIASAGHLQALMRDLTDVGALESGRLAVANEAVPLGEVLAGALASVGARAVAAGVSLSLAPVPAALAVRGDADRLRQCLVNLVSNGVKYNRRGGCVRVDAEVSRGQVRVRVLDDGLGMDDAQVAQLFEPFNRLGRGQGHVPGSGLGLVLTRQLARAMGGDLTVVSVEACGTCFTLHLAQHVDVPAQASPS